MQESAQEGVTFRFDVSDMRSLSILLIVVGLLLSFTGIFSSLLLMNDWVRRLRSPQGPQRVPLSTKTLLTQTCILAFLSVWSLTVLISTTAIVRTRHAMVMAQGNLSAPVLSTDTRYWDYGFLRCTAAAPWFSFLFSAPATIASGCAYWLHKAGRTAGRTDSSFEEKP